MGLVLPFLLKFLGGGALTSILNYMKARNESSAVKYGKLGEVIMRTIEGEVELRKVQASVLTTAMGHPIFWLGWILFVIPTAFYNGSIIYVSVLDAHLNIQGCVIPAIGQLPPPGRQVCQYFVRQIPALQETWANTMVMFIFGGQIVTGTMNNVISRLLPALTSKA